MGSCGGCGGSEVCWSDGGSAGLSGVSGERVWWVGGDGFGGSAALGVSPAVTLGFDDDLLDFSGSGVSGSPGLAELGGRQALAGLDAEALWRSDGASVGASDGLDGAALSRSGGPGVCVFDGVVRWMHGGLVPDASGELDGEVQLRSGEAAFAASGVLGAGVQMKNDGPWICAFGGAFLMTSSGLVASAAASQQMSGGLEIVATGGAPRQRNGELGLGVSG